MHLKTCRLILAGLGITLLPMAIGCSCQSSTSANVPQTAPPAAAANETAAEAETTKESNMGEKIVKTEAEWRELLTPEQFHVTRKKGTEPAGTGAYAYSKDKGVYRCVCCGLELYSSDHKFESGTGWPSFDRPIHEEHVGEKEDGSLWYAVRTEVICNRCDAHLGHVFDDGPGETTGKRHCINSAALDFEPAEDADK